MKTVFPTEHVLMAVTSMRLFDPIEDGLKVIDFMVPPHAEPDAFRRFKKASACIRKQIPLLEDLELPNSERYLSPYDAVVHMQFWLDDQIERLGPTIRLERLEL